MIELGQIIRCTKCGVSGLDILWDTRHIEDKLNNTIDVLTKKYANVQFVNKKLQEKIKRQSERITQPEALYREEVKTKKQNALRERAEKAEAMVERMIEVGYGLIIAPEGKPRNIAIDRYDTAVAEWKER